MAPLQQKRAREDDSEETEPKPLTPKKKSRHKKQTRIDGDQLSSDNSLSSDDELLTLRQRKAGLSRHNASSGRKTLYPQKRGRGRPRKPMDKEIPSRNRFSIPVFVEIAVAPKFRPGKTPKGNKLEKQEPRTEGPFSLTQKLRWDGFLDAIAMTVDEDLENLAIEGMSWGFKKAKWPLYNETGYHAMIQQIKTQKDPSALIIVVALPMPKVVQRKHQRRESEVDANVAVDDTLWGQKVGSHVTKTASYSHTPSGRYPLTSNLRRS